MLLGRHRYLLPLYGLVLAVGLGLVFSRRSVSALTPFVNLAAIVAVALPLLQIGGYTVSATLAAQGAQASDRDSSFLASLPADRPDIYYIILDTYTRADILQTDYEFDNQPFLDELRQMGFYVANCSMSNYASTELSLSSSLNFDYLENLAPEFKHMETLANDLKTSMSELMRHSRVRSDLKKIGYKTVAFETGYSWSSMTDADTYLVPGGTNAPTAGLRLFELMLLRNTAALPLLDYQQTHIGMKTSSGIPYYNEHIQRELYKLAELPSLSPLSSPKFVFAHILIPHGPFVFAPDGSIRTDVRFYENTGQAVDAQFEREGYVGQTEYINQRILPILREILAQSKQPPVIIIQGDHGLGKMGILNAYYLPGAGQATALYPSISPVNSFRVIFNAYFGTNYSPLDDRHFFSSADDRFNMQEVKDTMPECKN